MTADESADLFDNDLQSLFAGVQPAAAFEDRLIAAVRQRQRLRLGIPPPIRKAAIAAAAVMVVGAVGYYGNLAITGKLPFGAKAQLAKVQSNPHQIGLAIETPANNSSVWDFGGGSSHSGHGQNVLYGDGRAEWEKNPFAGTQHDNIFAGQGTTGSNNYAFRSTVRAGNSSAVDSMDSVLRPTASGDSSAASSADSKQIQLGASPVKLNNGTLALGGDNRYGGSATVTGGTLTLGDSRLGTGGYNGTSNGQAYGVNNNVVTGTAAGLNYYHWEQKAGQSPSPDSPLAPVGFRFDTNDPQHALRSGLVSNNPVSNAKLDPLNHFSISAVTSPQSGESKNSRFAPTSITQTRVTDNTTFRNANGNVLRGQDQASRTLDWVSNVGNAAVPGSIAANPADASNPIAGEDKIERETSTPNPLTPPIVSGTFQLPAIDVQGQPATNPTTAPAAVIDDRKIIRTGTMEFDVDRFDTAQMQITKIVLELGGFVGATDSQKLPNGKVRGSISVRVPPERLDVLVLSLRALGDLKSQQITAADVTKEYNDIESELKADRAMQDRLLDLIKSGKGAVKDLLAAENELGNWRTKIEKAEGMIRYFNSQIGLSTLTITLSERDIQTPSTAVETETADMGIEADDVEKARSSALKAIDDVRGRVVEAELKRFDAGQLAARLVADVPPESAGAVIDQLKLIGKVARLEINRQQTNSDGDKTVTNTTPLKTERKPTRLLISIYNLANVAPRRTTNVSLAASDVEAAYTALAAAAKTSGGRIVTSNLDRGDPVKATGSLVLEFPPDKFESAMTALHAQGDVLKLAPVENLDTQNSTEAKQGLTVQLVSLAAVPPRENIQQTLAATDVLSAYQTILAAANGEHARVSSAQLNEQDRQNITADLQLEIPRSAEMDFDKAVAAAGGTIARTSNRSAEAEGTVDSKLAVHLSITSADHLAPRETTKLQVEVADVDKSAANAQAAAISVGGRVLESTVTKDHGKGLARIILDLPLAKAGDVLQQVRAEGSVRGIDASRDANAPSGPMAHAQIFVEYGTTEAIVADQTGPWASIRQGLSTSITGLLWSLQWVIVGLCLIVPWVGIGWVGWKMKLRITKSRITKQ